MIGPILIIIGLYWLWAAFRGKAGPMLVAITGSQGSDSSLSAALSKLTSALQSGGTYVGGGGGGSGGFKGTITGNQADSGTHMGIDSSGNIITINSDYGSMTPEQKDAANNFAHQIGNV
jgi:hypothetical protein